MHGDNEQIMPKRTPPRVRYMRFPVNDSRCGLTGIGVLSILTLLCILLAIVPNLLAPVGGKERMLWGAALAVAVGVLVSVVWVDARRYRAGRFNKPPGRKRRLEQLAASANHLTRFPHRAVEYACRKDPKDRKALRSLMRRMERGTVIVANDQIRFMVPAPVPHVPFEPIDTRRDTEALTWLAGLSPGDEIKLRGLVEEHGKTPPRGLRPPTFWGRAKSGDVLCILGLVVVLIWTLIIVIPFGAPILVAATLASVYRLAWGREWWSVPGGLIYREHRLWRRSVRVGRLVASESALFVDHEKRVALVETHGRLHRVSGHERALLNAWTSPFPPPTMDSVITFFGPDAKPV